MCVGEMLEIGLVEEVILEVYVRVNIVLCFLCDGVYNFMGSVFNWGELCFNYCIFDLWI